jgi:hypothetical protein
VDELQTTTEPAYIFDSDSKLGKEVTLDPQGKVKEVYYIGPSSADAGCYADGTGALKIAKLLEMEKGVIWLVDPDESGHSYRHADWIGYQDGLAIFQAHYYFGKRDVNAETWGESLHVRPIKTPF